MDINLGRLYRDLYRLAISMPYYGDASSNMSSNHKVDFQDEFRPEDNAQLDKTFPVYRVSVGKLLYTQSPRNMVETNLEDAEFETPVPGTVYDVYKVYTPFLVGRVTRGTETAIGALGAPTPPQNLAGQRQEFIHGLLMRHGAVAYIEEDEDSTDNLRFKAGIQSGYVHLHMARVSAEYTYDQYWMHNTPPLNIYALQNSFIIKKGRVLFNDTPPANMSGKNLALFANPNDIPDTILTTRCHKYKLDNDVRVLRIPQDIHHKLSPGTHVNRASLDAINRLSRFLKWHGCKAALITEGGSTFLAFPPVMRPTFTYVGRSALANKVSYAFNSNAMDEPRTTFSRYEQAIPQWNFTPPS